MIAAHKQRKLASQCETPRSFVHSTVSPTWTETCAGAYATCAIFIRTPPAPALLKASTSSSAVTPAAPAHRQQLF